MLRHRLWPIAGLMLVLALAGGCGSTHGKAAMHKSKTHATGAKSTPATGTPVAVDGYTAYLSADVLANTPGVAAALTPYGLVWASYAAAVDNQGSLTMPGPYSVEISPAPGSGPLAGSGRLIAQIPNQAAGQAADLHFAGATGPYLAFTLDVAGTATTLAAGVLDLATGKMTMLPASIATNAGIVVGGDRIGVVGQDATYVFDPRTGNVATYPAGVAPYLWADLAYGTPVGSSALPDPAQPGVVAYPAGSTHIFAPAGWVETSQQLGGAFTIWRVSAPADAAAFVEVEAAPCMGCSVVSLTAGALPAPQIVLPDATGTPHVSEHWLSDYVISYEGTAEGYRYPVWGLAIAPRPGQSGFEEIVVSLPEGEQALAQAIISSYPLPR